MARQTQRDYVLDATFGEPIHDELGQARQHQHCQALQTGLV